MLRYDYMSDKSKQLFLNGNFSALPQDHLILEVSLNFLLFKFSIPAFSSTQFTKII